MRRLLLATAAAALALPVMIGGMAHASGCDYTTTEVPGVAAVYTDSDFPAGDPFGIWIYADQDGDGVVGPRDDSGCDAGEDGIYSADWVF